MTIGRTCLLWVGTLAFSSCLMRAQNPQQIIQEVVNTERAANQTDHSHWAYLEESHKPKEHVLQWVADTQQGQVRRVLQKNGLELPESRQRDLIREFLQDTKAQRKQVAESNHDSQQVDDFLKVLPVAFLWTQTGATATTTSLHFEPAPNFHSSTREARVFSSMMGDLTSDNQQHRIRSMRGHLIHDVNFGGGILGKLKENSSFSLDQEQVGPSLWQLTAIHVHLQGNALLFKSISLQQDDERSNFEAEPSAITLDQAASRIMSQPGEVQMHGRVASRVD